MTDAIPSPEFLDDDGSDKTQAVDEPDEHSSPDLLTRVDHDVDPKAEHAVRCKIAANIRRRGLAMSPEVMSEMIESGRL